MPHGPPIVFEPVHPNTLEHADKDRGAEGRLDCADDADDTVLRLMHADPSAHRLVDRS